MNKIRNTERLPWVSKGVVEINNFKYDCFLDNISDEGALVRFSNSETLILNPGTACKLKVILLNVIEYPCKVVRVNFPQIGLLFLAK